MDQFGSYRKVQVGFLTYDLQPFTEDCLYRVSRAITPAKIRAYPVLYHVHQKNARFPYRPSTLEGRFFVVRRKGYTPEGLTSSVNWSAAWACVRENKVVVLFGLQGGTALLATLLALIRGRRLISVNQTLPPEWERLRRWWVRWLKGWILRRCHVHVVQTPVTPDTLTQVYGVPEELCVEAPFESPATLFQELLSKTPETRDQLRDRFGWFPGESIFLFVGTLLRFKGIETIIRATALLHESCPAFRVFCVGPAAAQKNEPSIEQYRELAASLGVGETVVFLGKRSLDELARVYAAGDALLLPTERDMWPKVLFEASIAGLPLVTTSACGAAGHLVVEGETGFVIPPNDPEALAHAMLGLMDAQKRTALGKRAREICLTLCDGVKEVNGYVRAIKKALANEKGSRVS